MPRCNAFRQAVNGPRRENLVKIRGKIISEIILDAGSSSVILSQNKNPFQ